MINKGGISKIGCKYIYIYFTTYYAKWHKILHSYSISYIESVTKIIELNYKTILSCVKMFF